MGYRLQTGSQRVIHGIIEVQQLSQVGSLEISERKGFTLSD
jgi:hypothetical protein